MECLESGVFREDLPYKFRLNPPMLVCAPASARLVMLSIFLKDFASVKECRHDVLRTFCVRLSLDLFCELSDMLRKSLWCHECELSDMLRN